MAKKNNNARMIEERPLADLVPYARNARMHSDLQVAKLMALLVEQGGPVTLLADGTVHVNLGETGFVIRGAGLQVERVRGSVFLEEKPHRNSEHPTMKPVALVRRMVENSSEPGDVVLDLFGGRGSTLIACEQSGRAARLSELDPKFVDVIVCRWQEFTGRRARLEATGQTFAEVAAGAPRQAPAPVPVVRQGLMVAGRPYTEAPAANDDRRLGEVA